MSTAIGSRGRTSGGIRIWLDPTESSTSFQSGRNVCNQWTTKIWAPSIVIFILDNTCGAGGAQRNVGRPGKMIKSGKNGSFCEGMVKALITKRTKSGKNGPFCEGMVKALFSTKKLKKCQKKCQKPGSTLPSPGFLKVNLTHFFSGFFRNLEITRKNNPKGTSNCFPYDYQPYNFRKSREGEGGGGHLNQPAPVNVNSAARNNF